jgi:predicted metal-dependent HD superfamily phosphohydrolase
MIMNTTPLPTRVVPWTRLQGEPIFAKAERVMSSNKRRYFHNFAHNVDLYSAALHIYNLSYERALDLAILTHDVVFDSSSDRELRSIEWLRENLPDGSDDPDFSCASQLIETTIDHKITGDPRLVMLDLAGFIDPEVADRNTELLRKEASALQGVNETTFAVSCEAYLGEMLFNFRTGAEGLPNGLLHHHRKICSGIARTRSALDLEERGVRGLIHG